MAAAAQAAPTVVWRPQEGPQTALLTCPVFEVFYGGARGGGKTDGLLGDFIGHAGRYGKDAIGLMVRRELTQLIETIERSRQIYAPLGAKFHEQDKVWRFPNGARLRFAYLERDSDAEAYQGHSYSRVYVEEIGNFARPGPIMKLMATLRSGAGVPVGFRASGNPGGPGHQWVKARYIDPNPLGWEVISTQYANPFTGESVTRERVYIPSRVTDNHYLGSGYVANLQMAGSPELVRAWLEGDWSVVQGAYFPEFSLERHVLQPFEIPKHWVRFRAFDWGSAAPFSVGWYAVSDGVPLGIEKTRGGDRSNTSFEQNPQPQVWFPTGALIKYREWYGASEPNVGLKLTAEEVADGILTREVGEKIDYGVADPAAFSQDGGPSIMERMMMRKCMGWRRADNARVARAGSLGGWDQLRQRLKGDERPMLYFFSTCKDTIRTLPALQHDVNRPEDVDSEGEDHAPDETRYACMSRPWTRKLVVAPEMTGLTIGGKSNVTLNQLWANKGKRPSRI